MGVQDPDRQTWSRQIQFLFVIVGQGVGFGNVWRFPYVCYKNGGGVFLIPYAIAVFLLGIPGAFLEGSIGQFTSRGVISAFKLVPLFQGVGHMIAMLGYLTMCYYSVLFAWVLYYLFSSMKSPLPWSHCNNTWNTQACWVGTVINSTITDPLYSIRGNSSENGTGMLLDPATEFWERKVLSLSPGVGHPGTVKWDMALCHLLAWVLIYFCIWKGAKWIGKISYVTATAPYLLLTVLLIHGLTLDGSADGIKFYLSPDWNKLSNPQVWLDGCIQAFYSYGIGLAIHPAIASCNEFHNNILKHYLLFAIINSGTSFLCGFVIFSALGFMADAQGVTIDKVAESGPGLAFIVFPQAISQMPVPQLWAVLFFLMLSFIAIDSEFAGIDAIIVSLQDLLPNKYQFSPYKELFSAFVCLTCYLAGLSMITEGGVYVQQIIEWYCAGKIMFIVMFLECVVIAYGYGSTRFQNNLEYMLGYRIGPFFKYLWLIVTPAISLVLLVTDIILYPDLTYKRKSGIYRYPEWTKYVGWALVLSSVIWVPVILIWRLGTTPGTLYQRVRHLLRPDFTETQRQRDRGFLSCEKDTQDSIILSSESKYNDDIKTVN